MRREKNLWSKPGFDPQTVNPTLPTVIMRLLIEAKNTFNWKCKEGSNSFNDGGESNNNNNYRGRQKTILTDIRLYPEVQWQGN